MKNEGPIHYLLNNSIIQYNKELYNDKHHYKTPKSLEIKHILVNNLWDKVEITTEIRKYFELNNNNNGTAHRNP